MIYIYHRYNKSDILKILNVNPSTYGGNKMDKSKTVNINPLINMIIKSVIYKHHIHIYNKRYTLNDLYMDIIGTYQINIYEYKILNILNNMFGYMQIHHIYNMGNKSDIKK